MSENVQTPLYIIGNPCCPSAAFIKYINATWSSNQETFKLTGEFNSQQFCLKNTGIILGEGTYGTVYLYRNKEKTLSAAVKIFESENNVAKLHSSEIGHPFFPSPTERLSSANIILTAVFETFQVMEMGIGTARDFPSKSFPHMIRIFFLELLDQRLVCPDIKPDNIIAFKDLYNDDSDTEDDIEYKAADVDSIGCWVSALKTDCPEYIGNRIASFPFAGTQQILGYPISDLIQTWYSIIISSYVIQLQYVKKNMVQNHALDEIEGMLLNLDHRHFKKRTNRNMTTGDLFIATHPIHAFATKMSEIFSCCIPLYDTINYIRSAFSFTRLPLLSTNKKHIALVTDILRKSIIDAF